MRGRSRSAGVIFPAIDAVTLERANSAARKYYRTDNLTFTLPGNAKAVRESIARFAPHRIEVDFRQAGFEAPAR